MLNIIYESRAGYSCCIINSAIFYYRGKNFHYAKLNSGPEATKVSWGEKITWGLKKMTHPTQ